MTQHNITYSTYCYHTLLCHNRRNGRADPSDSFWESWKHWCRLSIAKLGYLPDGSICFFQIALNPMFTTEATSFEVHGGPKMRESRLKHICDSIFCPSAMRNLQRRGHVSRRPAARHRRRPHICTEFFLLDCNFSFFITMWIHAPHERDSPHPSRSVLLYGASVQRACKDV